MFSVSILVLECPNLNCIKTTSNSLKKKNHNNNNRHKIR